MTVWLTGFNTTNVLFHKAVSEKAPHRAVLFITGIVAVTADKDLV